MNPVLAIALVLTVLGVLVGVVKLLQARGAVGAEGARKLVHIGMGCVCLTFPWLFVEPWPVWTLAVLAVGALAALRLVPALKRDLGGVLHGVERVSLGEVYFPLGVAAVFTLARGHTLLFVVPVALLTFADAAGALVGKRIGRTRYDTLEGQKSVEGSVAVALVSLACGSGPLLLAGHAWPTALLIGAVMGLFGALVEAVAWRGLDNVFLPLVAFAQLSIYLGLSPAQLGVRLAVLVVFVVAALVWRRGGLVDHAARLTGALALYFFWVVGGGSWLVAPVLLLVSYSRLMPVIPGGPPRHNLIAVICIASAALPWAVAQAVAPLDGWLWPHAIGLATHQAIIATVRCTQARKAHWRAGSAVLGWAQAVGVQVLLGWTLVLRELPDRRTLAVGIVSVALGLGAFLLLEPKLARPDDLNARWWKQGACALTAAAVAYWLASRGGPLFS